MGAYIKNCDADCAEDGGPCDEEEDCDCTPPAGQATLDFTVWLGDEADERYDWTTVTFDAASCSFTKLDDSATVELTFGVNVNTGFGVGDGWVGVLDSGEEFFGDLFGDEVLCGTTLDAAEFYLDGLGAGGEFPNYLTSSVP